MKIFIIDKSRYCGGAERSLALLLKTLPREAEIFLVTDYASTHLAECESFARGRVLRRFSTLAFIPVFLERFSRFRWVRALSRILMALALLPLLLKYRPDAVDFNLFRSLDQWDLRICRLCRIKTVCHIRSLHGQIILPPAVIPLVDHFICVSRHVADGFSEIPENKKSVIHNAVEANPLMAKVSQREAREKLGLAENGILIGSVAVCEKRKGHDAAIGGFAAVAAEFPSARLLVIGRDVTPGQAETARLKDIALKLGVADRVSFAEFKPELMPFVYIALDLVLALSSDGEAFGRVPIEAGCYGRMSVVSACGAFLETVSDMRTGILIPPTAEALASKLRALLQSPAERERMSENARVEFPARFSPVLNSEKTLQVYKQVLGRK
ncbi:MAG: glycosyltransferase family 4 protein [Lentisphaeria bacterium]|nr:glycosyltransferase family 4 protein [Lentisphaeria bacterium]